MALMIPTRVRDDANVGDFRVMLGLVALDLPCPFCGAQMYAEQAHNRCPACLYIEPCCDGAPQPCRLPAAQDAATA
jgi:hypothetical protein